MCFYIPFYVPGHSLNPTPLLPSQATWHPNLRHAFCISQRQSLEAAEHVVGSIVRPLLYAASPSAAAAATANDHSNGHVELPQWGSAVLRGSPSAVSVSRGPASPSPSGSSSRSGGSGAGGGAADTADTAAAQPHATYPAQHHPLQQHYAPHGDQQAALYGQTAAVRRQMYGDDVAGSARHDAMAAVAAAGFGSRGAADGVSDDQIELDVFGDGAEPAAGGSGGGSNGKLAQRGSAAAATASSSVAVLASSGAAAVAAGGVVTRSMARRQGAAGGGR